MRCLIGIMSFIQTKKLNVFIVLIWAIVCMTLLFLSTLSVYFFLLNTTLCKHFFITSNYIFFFHLNSVFKYKELDSSFWFTESLSSSLGQLTCTKSNAFLIISYYLHEMCHAHYSFSANITFIARFAVKSVSTAYEATTVKSVTSLVGTV